MNSAIGCKLLKRWWACRDSNPEPRDYESPALTVELQARLFHIKAKINRCWAIFRSPSQCDTAAGLSPLAGYLRAAIRASRALLGGRVTDSGSVASGSSTTFSRSMKVGFSVLI